MNGVVGFMYPNEYALQWSILIVLYPFITGLVAGAFILASLERVFRVEAVKPTYRLALLTALAFLLDAPRHFGHGHVRLRLSLVPHGGPGLRNLARLSPRHRDSLAAIEGLAACD